MKNFRLIFLLACCCFLTFSFQDSNDLQQNPTPENIKILLIKAEKSINTMQFDKALQQLDLATKFSKEIDQKRYLALSSSIAARLYHIRMEFDKGITELQRAISIQREIGDDEGLAFSYLNYGKLFGSKQENERALKYLDLAEKYYEKQDNSAQLGIVALNKAIVYFHSEENTDRVFNELNNAEIYLKESDNFYEKTRFNYYLARAYHENKEYSKAKNYALKSLEMSKNNKFLGMEMHSLNLLSRISEKQNELNSALAYLQAGNEIRERIFNLNKEALSSESSAKFNIDALKSTVDELTIRNAEQERTLKVNKLTTILSVALITILSLLTLSLYKNNNLRARANGLLQKKNDELTIAKENAEKASLAKAQFLSTITHELRTPLYAVTGLTHLLLEEDPTENQKEHLSSLKFSGEYLLSLINNILDLNKLEANKVEIMESKFDLKKRMADVLVALKNSADEKNTVLHFNFDKNIPKIIIGDPLKISQILINLIGNSIKFTQDGDIWIKVEQTKQEGKKLFLHFEIQDNVEVIF